MTPTHAAALAVLRESFSALEETIAGVAASALDWRPWDGANPLAVLVMHAVTSARFFGAASAGHAGSFEEYLSGERAAAFAAGGLSETDLRAAIAAAEHDLTDWFAAATVEDLERRASFRGSPADGASGTDLLFRTVAHLREHVGHAQAVRDLWQATKS